jgi:hypothetical protein
LHPQLLLQALEMMLDADGVEIAVVEVLVVATRWLGMVETFTFYMT